jgi:transcriptional regulator with XRE-family HTH domain
MPLDTGDMAGGLGDLPGASHVGAALRAVREARGLSQDDISRITKVRPAYVDSIEALDFDTLPALPFVVGYVRAYALALGMDADAAVARLKAEAPKSDGKLRAPFGVRYDAFSSIRWLMIVGALIAGAVLLWNLARRVELQALKTAPAPISRGMAAPAPVGPAQIGAPLPTPPEATTPPTYETPGLELAGPPKPAEAPATSGARPHDLTDGEPGVAGAPFAPQGTIYGAAAPGAGVILQAKKSTTLIVRGAGGAVIFAGLLKPGEAWRAPAGSGLMVDVGEPRSVEVFVAGVSRGHMRVPLAPLDRLAQP